MLGFRVLVQSEVKSDKHAGLCQVQTRLAENDSLRPDIKNRKGKDFIYATPGEDPRYSCVRYMLDEQSPASGA
jgi:hypothetical protein